MIYSALDFGLKENEERTLTPGLENLLDFMTSLGEFSRFNSVFVHRLKIGPGSSFRSAVLMQKESISEISEEVKEKRGGVFDSP